MHVKIVALFTGSGSVCERLGITQEYTSFCVDLHQPCTGTIIQSQDSNRVIPQSFSQTEHCVCWCLYERV